MYWWIPLAATAISGALQSDAAGDAADSQSASNRDALQFQRNAALASLRQSYPVYRGQVNALNRLYGMQGLPSIQAPELNALLSQFRGGQNMQNMQGARQDNGDRLQQYAFDPLDIMSNDVENALFDPFDFF